MGQRQDTLAKLLRGAGYPVGSARLSRPGRKQIEEAGLASDVDRVYRRLGGSLPEFPAAAGIWDICLGKVVVEVDEERHFNRYRLMTLESELYLKLPLFPRTAYQSYSQENEAGCLKAAGWGGNWANRSTARQFGQAGPLRTLPSDSTINGPSRWKQRAFYDLIKDLSVLTGGPPLARLQSLIRWNQVAS